MLIASGIFAMPLDSTTQIDYEPAQELEGFLVLDYDETELYKSKKLIKQIATDVSESREYELHVFDCTDFSKKLVRELRGKGFKASCSTGYYLGETDYPQHTWVSVDVGDTILEVEATGGYIIDQEEFKNYDKTWEGLCL